MIPANTLVEFHVTSLDVIHSFWAYQLGVKADANPGKDNIAYVNTKAPLTFNIHCAELCGVWHGYMFAAGKSCRRLPSPAGSWAHRSNTARRPSRFRRTHGRTSQTHKGEVDDRYRDNGAYAAAAAA